MYLLEQKLFMFLVLNTVSVLRVGWSGMHCKRTHSYCVSFEYSIFLQY